MVAGCGVAAAACSPPPPVGPDTAVLEWMQAFAAQDGNAVARLTCRAAQSDAQNAQVAAMVLGIGAANYGAGGGQPAYDVSDLHDATIFDDERNARVQVSGLLRVVTGWWPRWCRWTTP